MDFYKFLSQNSLYVVLFVVLIIWAGIYSYLFRLDRRLRRAEDQVEKHHHER
ncbi:MAG: CcmD family protein [Ignavibacteriales bacterium CG07_land_8_20_14_0_80_59_12]|nr:MAG: CcmD family protein [Ignavibacteriales bacterium CG07_land_8_20_14_0_80_59_12]